MLGLGLKGRIRFRARRARGRKACDGLPLRNGAALVHSRRDVPYRPLCDRARKCKIERTTGAFVTVDKREAGGTIEVGARIATVEKGAPSAVDSVDEVNMPCAVEGAVRRRSRERASHRVPATVRRLQGGKLERRSRPRHRVHTHGVPDRACLPPRFCSRRRQSRIDSGSGGRLGERRLGVRFRAVEYARGARC